MAAELGSTNPASAVLASVNPGAPPLAAAIRRRLTASPDKRLLTLLDETGAAGASWSAAEILALADVWSARLRSAGVVAGSVVALAPPRDESLLALHLAALECGAAVVPLNPSLAPSELSAVVLECRAKVIATSAALAQANKKTAAALTAPWWIIDGEPGYIGHPFSQPPEPPRAAGAGQGAGEPSGDRGDARSDTLGGKLADDGGAEHDGEDGDSNTALVLYTSGTTGRPKSVPLSHANLLANLNALSTLWQRSADDRLLHVLPAHHFHGLVLALYGSLLAGNEIFLLPAFNARATLDAIASCNINLLMAVPTIYSRLLAEAGEQDELSGLRLAVTGSAPLGETAWQRFYSRFGVELVERYGLTETGIIAANAPGNARAGSVGRPLADTTVTLLGGSGYAGPTPGARSEQGEICVSGPSVTPGYGNDEQATANAFHHGRFHSGDLGYFDADGYLWIDGRLKDLIIVGGTNVVPGEIENVLQKVEGVAEVAAAGRADDDLGEIVVAYVVADPEYTASAYSEATYIGATDADPTEAAATYSATTDTVVTDAPATDAAQAALEARLREAATAQLARYKQPRHYFFIAELPRNAMGKIDRGRLVAPTD